MNIRSMLARQPLMTAVLAISLAMAGHYWLKPNECSPDNKGPFDGKVLYSCTVKVVADVHKGNVDPSARQTWLAMWKHRFDDSYMLQTPEGTLKAVTEMLMSMNERFDYFYTPADTAKSAVEASGEMAGIGVQLQVAGINAGDKQAFADMPEYITDQALSLLKDKFNPVTKLTNTTHLIVAEDPKDGTPAFNAGIKAGDELLKLNGTSIVGMDLSQLTDKVRGPAGSRLTLTINSAAEHKMKILNLMRQVIKLPVAQGSTLGDLGVVKIDEFESLNTANDVHHAVDAACGRTETDSVETPCKAKGLIIDLRNNRGGRVDYVLEVSELFLDTGDLLTIHMRQGNNMSKQTFVLAKDDIVVTMPDGSVQQGKRWTEPEFPSDRPIVVLVNKYTASGAEALAEMLQANKRAVVVGQRTRGKGVGQCPLELPFGYSIMPICMEYSVAGKSVDWVGVTPNLVVDQMSDGTEDLQMNKAVEIAHNPALAADTTVPEDLDAVMKQRKAAFELSQQKIRQLLHL